MQSKIIVLIFYQLLCFSILSCTKNKELVGCWDNQSQSLIINIDDTFELQYKNSENIKAFRGKCFYSEMRLFLVFNEYQDINSEWISLSGTELESYTERITFQINDDKLETFIVSTGKLINYSRKN